MTRPTNPSSASTHLTTLLSFFTSSLLQPPSLRINVPFPFSSAPILILKRSTIPYRLTDYLTFTTRFLLIFSPRSPSVSSLFWFSVFENFFFVLSVICRCCCAPSVFIPSLYRYPPYFCTLSEFLSPPFLFLLFAFSILHFGFSFILASGFICYREGYS